MFLPILSPNSSKFNNNREDFDDREENAIKDDFNKPKLNVLGNDTWWDYSFRYRRLISINNPYPLNFTDYGVSVSFNYTQLIQDNKIYQTDLDDIRIVEDGKLRKYYVVKDFPQQDFATVYFDTNISQLTTELDTFMYLGNDAASNAEAINPTDSFGWIKNGDFELDIRSDTQYNPYGWTFTHEPINELGIVSGDSNPFPSAANESDLSYEYFQNKPMHISDVGSSHRRVENGNYAYLWGTFGWDTGVYDYAGTFYSYPFMVPKIQGGNLYLRVYRNIRTQRFERREKPQDDIDIDGYFMRICNVTSYSSDVDSHVVLNGEYLEAYGGNDRYSPSGKYWSPEGELQDHDGPSSYDTESLGSGVIDGDLTGIIYYDITSYMGEEIFLECGAWGEELGLLNQNAGEKQAFFQLDYIGFNYSLPTSIDEVQAHNSTITIIARDVDGRLVPDAEISLVNNSIAKGLPGHMIANGYTDSSGRLTLSLIPNGRYNITANYTRGSREIEVFNSFSSGLGPYYFNGIFYSQEIELDIWTIDFEISDWDKIPLSQGFIEINESLGGSFIDKLVLDEYGKGTFRWQTAPQYYFSVYYDNEDYYGSPMLLNESYVYRNFYERSGVKFRNQSLGVINTNRNPGGSNSYSVRELIYTNGSRTTFGNKKIIKFNVTLSNMVNQLTNVSIYYVDKDNSTGIGDENLIYYADGYGPGDDDDFIEIDIPLIDNDKLVSDDFEVYGLLIHANGINFTLCNGIITLETVETCNIFNRTELARLNIRVIRKEAGVEVPYPALIKVIDVKTGQMLVNLTSRLDRDGYSYTPTHDLPFWYLKDRIYNISINSLNVTNIEFNVTNISPINQWYPTDKDGITWYNYTLYGGSSITFNLIFKTDVNITNYITAFFNASGTGEAFWGEDLTFSISFYLTEDNGQTWNPITNPSASCTVYVREVGSEINLISKLMELGIGAGNHTLTFNSSLLSAGGLNTFYTVRIEGNYPGYPNPSPESFIIKIKSIPTRISAHDYNTLTELTDESYTSYFDELINITLRYSINESGIPLNNAVLTHTWIGQESERIFIDPLNDGYYTFTINTSKAQTIGLKIISIIASYENYTTQLNFLIYLNILARQSTLNGETDLVYLSPKIWVQQAQFFVFTYSDANTLEDLGDLTVASYSWYELDESGNRIPGSQGTGTLTQYPNMSYYLDFNTELRAVGDYFLHVSLQKTNFEPRFAYINLEIKLREFEHSLDKSAFKIPHGNNVNFEINLTDLTRGDIGLENALITLSIGGNDHNFTESPPGMYTLTFETAGVDTFFTSKTFVGIITIEMANFTAQELQITIVVEMEEIFTGMPTFYFILITASIVGVVGSIVGYRVIQQARIPKHVKKIRKIKGQIKSNKKISDTFSIPTKEEMTIKLFGSDWRDIGISISDVLGNQELKPIKGELNGKISKDGGEGK
ncbi:MAG: carboxypeptidase-like regulatory domain-containing protein [Promethearchaeota archaeon]|jgi:hypothetical protein